MTRLGWSVILALSILLPIGRAGAQVALDSAAIAHTAAVSAWDSAGDAERAARYGVAAEVGRDVGQSLPPPVPYYGPPPESRAATASQPVSASASQSYTDTEIRQAAQQLALERAQRMSWLYAPGPAQYLSLSLYFEYGWQVRPYTPSSAVMPYPDTLLPGAMLWYGLDGLGTLSSLGVPLEIWLRVGGQSMTQSLYGQGDASVRLDSLSYAGGLGVHVMHIVALRVGYDGSLDTYPVVSGMGDSLTVTRTQVPQHRAFLSLTGRIRGVGAEGFVRVGNAAMLRPDGTQMSGLAAWVGFGLQTQTILGL